MAMLTAVSPAWAAGSMLIGHVVDESTGEPLPARVYITGPDGNPYLPPPHKGESVAHYDVTRIVREVYAAIGAHPFRVEVPAGKTTVTVERGKEYAPVTREIDIGDGQTIEARFRLQRSFNMAARGWYSGDLHVHTPVEHLRAMQLAEDLNVAFPITAWATDDRDVPRNRKGGGVPASGEQVRIDDTHAYWNLNTEYEIFRAQGLKGELGAIMFLGHTQPFNTQKAPPIGPIAAEARRQGAIIDWDKHCWPWSTMLVPVAGVQTIELSNNHMWRLKPHFLLWGQKPPAWMRCANDASGWAEYGFQAYYALLNSGFVLRPSAGTANGVHPVPLGHSRVYVHLDGGFSYEQWVDRLQAGRSFVTNGPMLLMRVDGMMPGDRRRLPLGETRQVDIEIEALTTRELDRVEIIVNGKVARTFSQQQLAHGSREGTYRVDARLAVDGSSWICARCFEAAPADNVRFAHTGPVFFDDPSRLLRPEPWQIEWLINSVAKQLERVDGILPPATVDEYRQALRAYQAVAGSPAPQRSE